MREVTLLLLVDRLSLKDRLFEGLASSADGTSKRVVRAAEALGLVHRRDGQLVWAPSYSAAVADDAAWQRIVSVARHQVTYLTLVASDGSDDAPATQVAANPAAYLDFLRGVDVSHREHAGWFANLRLLWDAGSLCDLGGGLGTFAKAWVSAREDRSAVLADLPEVISLVAREPLQPRISLRAVDLSKDSPPDDADVYLLANVLHLLPEWKDVLHRVAAHARPGAVVAVFEADPQGVGGALFDLQVHLRSGSRGGLIGGDALRDGLRASGLAVHESLITADPADPFERRYELLLARRPRSATQ